MTLMATMIVIEGRNGILNFVQRELEQKWKILNLRYNRVRWKILFAFFFLLNHKYKPTVSIEQIGEDPNWFRPMLRTLDVLLRHEWNIVDLRMSQDEITKYGRIVLTEFSELGKLQDLYLECKAFKVERLVIEENQKITDTKIKLDTALEDWLKSSLLDAEWFEYYEDTSSRAGKLRKAINQELKEKHGVTLEFLDTFGRAIGKDIEDRLEPEETKMVSLIAFFEAQLVKRLQSLDKNVDAYAFINEIEYKPEESWVRKPFVRLQDNSTQDIVYFPINFAFFPGNVFAGSWVYHIAMAARRSSAIGIMGEEWGDRFEKYVRNRLNKCHPHLKISSGVTISRLDYPDILDCVRKPSIEIDIVAHSDENVYLISCKAPDQFYGPKMLRTLMNVTSDEFERKLNKDLQDAWEIEKYAHCVKQSNRYLESFGYEGKRIIPILMTSDVRPLSLESVCEWATEAKIVNTLPDVQIVQAKKINEIRFK